MIFRTISSLQSQVSVWKHDSKKIGLVPTMGALHNGHLSLVHEARKQCDRVIVSIFVNPKQFDDLSDLSNYPRSEKEDIALLGGADAIFIPSPQEMYPEGFASTIHVEGLAERLEGEHRPGHFNGMATVVMKLFNITRADTGFFGEKDWQQLQIIRQMVLDFNHPISIVGCPTLRESDGLAKSSRNRRLSPEDRLKSKGLYLSLLQAATCLENGGNPNQAIEKGMSFLIKSGFEKIDYFTICDERNLHTMLEGMGKKRIMAAAWINGIRLIDNIEAL